SVEQVAELQRGLKERAIDVLIVDPLYLCLLAGSGPTGPKAENLFDVGPLLLAIAQACLSIGVTPVLAHHTKKGSSASLKPLDLDDLAYSGVAEFSRQWLLLSRREEYEPGTGIHRMLLNVGGSAGQSGLWALEIAEGVIGEDFTGRKWEVAVATATEARQ